MRKESRSAPIIIGAIILAIFATPFVFLSYALFFAWDSQESGEFYKPAFEKNGKLYELNIDGSSLAFDSGTKEDHLFLNSMYNMGGLIALSYDDYDINKTDNPYFAGTIAFRNNKYLRQETKYRTAKDSYEIYRYYDQNGNLLFAYEPEMQSEYVIKLRPTFPAFSKRKYGIGNKREYLNATKLIKAKLNKNLKIRTDETNKLLIIWFENL
jgi:hypothetical protein